MACDSSPPDDVSDAFACVVDAASAAVSAAAASARLDASATKHHVALSVLHHVLSGCSGRKRGAAITRLPCFITQLSPTALSGADEDVRLIVSAAAVAAMSLSCSAASQSYSHPLAAANRIMMSAASRVGIYHPPLDSFVKPFITHAQASTSPSSKFCRHWLAPLSPAQRFTSWRANTPLGHSRRLRCAWSLLQSLLLRAAVDVFQWLSAACC